MPEFSKGQCSDMCPAEERKWRKEKKLIHVLEMGGKCKKVIDESKMVKQFSRSAAGQKLSRPEILRQPDCLFRTVEYLLTEIINEDIDWRIKYEFISDRLRSVRQDAVIQNLEYFQWLRMLPSMIRFHCYAMYRLRSDDIVFWDSNLKCLADCFTTLMDVYEYLKNCTNFDTKEQQEMETLYSLIKIKSLDVITKYTINFDEVLYPPAGIMLSICKDFVTDNYIRILGNIQRLPIIHQCLYFALHADYMKKIMLKQIFTSYGCGNKVMKYPVSKLMIVLQYDTWDEFINACSNFNIKLSEDKKFIIFTKQQKQTIDNTKSTVTKNGQLEKTLADVNLSSIILNRGISDGN